jgi:hypothetical protein
MPTPKAKLATTIQRFAFAIASPRNAIRIEGIVRQNDKGRKRAVFPSGGRLVYDRKNNQREGGDVEKS